MKSTIAGIFLALLASGHAEGVPLAQAGGMLNGISVAQAMATADVLGEWRLHSGGWVRVLKVMSRVGGECGVSGTDDADTCHRYMLLVSAFGETSVPVDFMLFQGPETLGWKVPKIAHRISVPENSRSPFWPAK